MLCRLLAIIVIEKLKTNFPIFLIIDKYKSENYNFTYYFNWTNPFIYFFIRILSY